MLSAGRKVRTQLHACSERIVGYSALHDDSGGLLISFGLDKAQAFTAIQKRTRRDICLIVMSTSPGLARDES